jgi:soluble lytic murein transglycosylase-like protein
MPQGSGSNAGSPDTARANRQRGANGRFTGDGTQANDESTQGSGNRDSRGRFTGGNGANAAERSATSRITDSLKDLSNTLTVNANTDRIDPMVDAIKEAGSVISTGVEAGKKVLSVGNTLIAKPAMALGRGIKGLFKPKTDVINSPTSWYKRIWRTLVQGNRQDQTQHNQEQRRLDEIARGQGQRGGADGGLLGLLGVGLLAGLAALKHLDLPSLPEFLKKKDNNAPVPVFRAPTMPVTSLPPTRTQSLVMRLADTKVGKVLGTFVKRLPIISSVLAAGSGGINAVNISKDNSLSDAEKERAQAANLGKTVGAIGGGLGGTAVGAAIGTAIFPVVGTVLGGLIGSWLGTEGGQIVGEKVGGWVDDLANADIAGRISNAWNGFLTPLTPIFTEIKAYALGRFDAVGKVWDGFVAETKMQFSGIMAGLQAVADFFGQVGDFWGGVADAANTWIKEKTGIDVKDNLKRSKEMAAEKAKGVATTVANNAGSFWQGVKDAPIVQAVGGALSGLTGETAKEKAARERNLNAKGYNAYKDILEDEYSRHGFKSVQEQAFLKGQVQQESNFDATKINKDSGAFGSTQFMPATAKQYGVMRGDSPEAVHSQANGQARYMQYLLKRYGGDWDKALAGYNGGEGNLDKKLKTAKETGVDWKTLLPQETKDYLVKVKQNAMNFGAVSASQAPTVSPKVIATPTANMATNSVPSMKAAPVNAVPVPNVQSIQSVQAKEQPTRLNSTPTPIKVSFAKPLVGQNVSDRGIAHILTGGIGETV